MTHPHEFFRDLTDVCCADVRNTTDGKALDDLHRQLSEVLLHKGVPEEIRVQFDNAKNLSLYSWFVYRFHPIARVVGCSCLEAALRVRFTDEGFVKPAGRRHAGFKHMLKHAVESGWIRNDGFEIARRISHARAKHKAMIDGIRSDPKLDTIPVREPTPEEVERELRSLPYAKNLVDSIPLIRNHLAHGNAFLDSGSVSALRVVAEAINQLFPEPVASEVDQANE